jgi:copper oxidase (laccase) domain-containing protein
MGCMTMTGSRSHTSTPTESASSLTDLLFTRDLPVVLGPSAATESMEVSPSVVGPGTASASDGIEIVVSPAEVDEVDFRGMTGLLVEPRCCAGLEDVGRESTATLASRLDEQ